MRFTEFLKECVLTEVGVVLLNEGIEHLEALPIDKFLSAVENLSKFTTSEKLDGANLIFGFDNDGKFYTSREAKSGGKMYSVGDYQSRAADNGFKSAHAALKKVAPQLKKVLNDGDAVEVEVLFGRQPNAIVYGSSYIALLRMVPGENKKHPDQSKIRQLADELYGTTVTVTTPHVTTTDGVNLETVDVAHQWKFTSVSYVDSHHFASVDVARELSALTVFLKEKNRTGGLGLTNMDIIGIKLTSVPSGLREAIKNERDRLTELVNAKFKLPIKEKFLDAVLRKMSPALRDVEIGSHEDIGVEGVVMLNPQTLEQIKIVDKDIFSIINQFNHAIRNEIKSTSRGRAKFEGVSIINGGDIFGDMLQRIASVIGIPELGEYISIKRVIKKYAGKNEKETLQNFTNAFKTQDVLKTKSGVVAGIKEGVRDLEAGLKKYNAEWQSYKLKLKTGKEIRYTNEIHNRTLMVFAEVRKEMMEMMKATQNAKNLDQLAVALYGKQLKSV